MRTDVAVDGFDLKLLAALQQDGRLTNQELAERVLLSPSQCSRRRQALEEAGLIRFYSAEIDAEALGLAVMAMVQVTLATHSGDNARRFRELVARVDAIQEAYSLTGDADYLLRIVVRDLKGLSRIINEVLLPHESVAHVRSSIVLDRLKEHGRLPLGEIGLL